jgi:hypothetical protein
MARTFCVLLLLSLLVGCSARPIPSPTPQFTVQEAPTATLNAPSISTPTVTPIVVGEGGDESSSDDSLIGQIIDGFILPLWNFFLSLTVDTVRTLWTETGERGGFVAQLACCVLPLIGLLAYFYRSYERRRRR